MVKRTVRCVLIVKEEDQKKLDEAIDEGERIYRLVQEKKRAKVETFLSDGIKENMVSLSKRSKLSSIPLILDFKRDCQPVIKEDKMKNEKIFIKIQFSPEGEATGYLSFQSGGMEYIFDAMGGELSFGKANLYRNGTYLLDIEVNKRDPMVDKPKHVAGISIRNYKIYFTVFALIEKKLMEPSVLDFSTLKDMRKKLFELKFDEINDEEILEKKDRETILYIRTLSERMAKILSRYGDTIAFIENPRDRGIAVYEGDDTEEEVPGWMDILVNKFLERSLEWNGVPLIEIPSVAAIFECPFGSMIWQDYKKILKESERIFPEDKVNEVGFKIIVEGLAMLLYMPEESVGEVNPFAVLK
ncbi:MAG: hypothetical protein MASP_00455 [Candidatus Methanolliviera sp. GoM_asphalt]|nr:MAG: hypothetical protein MASP_00455 [Candidatus Methanolliviera sp. GoM_asphalt]